MAKKSDPHAYLASPASAAVQRPPYVSGAILEKATAAEPDRSPAAAEPLPAGRWPRVDVTPEPLRERILATTDQETLELWLRRAASAASLDEMFDEV